MKTVFVQNWMLRDRWSGPEDWGFTIHTSKEQLQSYVLWYHKTNHNEKVVPDSYISVDGEPKEVEVEDDLFERLSRAADFEGDGEKAKNYVHGKGDCFPNGVVRSLRDTDVQWPEGFQ